MKKTVSFYILVLIAQLGFAQLQTTHPWTGTNTVTPTTRSGRVMISSSLANGSTFSNTTDRNIQCNVLRLGKTLSLSGSLFNFLDFPQSNLNSQAQSFFGIEDRNYKSRFRYYANTGGASEQIYYDRNQNAVYRLQEDAIEGVHMSLPKENSSVSIGTSSYEDGSDLYSLSVNGKVRAESVKVYTDWADFVFEKDYDLASLEEVKNHIAIHGHLKDIPSAKEVEENGIDVGEMNKLLLQKVEELTLYLIEKDEQIKELSSKVNEIIATKK